jgi:choline kinase
MLAMAGITRVSVVIGYRAKEVQAAIAHRARTILNPQWEDTNSLYSFSLCHGHVRAPLLVLNCDVLVHPVALQRLLNARCSALLYDSSSGRDVEEMKVELDRGFLSAMSKTLPHHRAKGENVGILYFEADALRSLFQEARLALNEGHRNGWLATAVERTARRWPVRGIDIADLPWIEIDFPDDLLRACDLTWRQLSGVMDPAVRLAS